MNVNKHIEKETLISKIDNNLDGDFLAEVDAHLKECSDCLISYAQIKTGYLELEEAELESAPSDLFMKAQRELGVDGFTPSNTEKIAPDTITHVDAYDKELMLSSKYSISNLVQLGFVMLLGVLIWQNPYISNNNTASNSTILYSYYSDSNLRGGGEDVAVLDMLSDNSGNNITRGGGEKPLPSASPNQSLNPLVIPITRNNLPGYLLQDLSTFSSLSIFNGLKRENLNVIIYESDEFLQSPSPGTFIQKTDTIKIYIQN